MDVLRVVGVAAVQSALHTPPCQCCLLKHCSSLMHHAERSVVYRGALVGTHVHLACTSGSMDVLLFVGAAGT